MYLELHEKKLCLEYLEKSVNHLKINNDGSKCEIKTACALFVPSLKVGSFLIRRIF